MTNLEKIHALQAGEFDKVLEGTPYGDQSVVRQRHTFLLQYVGRNLIIEHGEANAAKVEVTKGVLDEAIGVLDSYWVGNISKDIEEALTILKTLQEALKR